LIFPPHTVDRSPFTPFDFVVILRNEVTWGSGFVFVNRES
jgi:hypothetical protein